MPTYSGLLVSISRSNTTYYILAETCAHSFSRLAAQLGMPSGTEGSVGQVFTLDLGQCTEQINISGIVDSSGTPSKTDLETVCRQWWGYTNFTTTNNLPIITLESGQAYYCAIKSAEFKREAAKEDRWDMNLSFIVAQKV